MKRIISMMLVIAMTIGGFPVGEIIAFAAEDDGRVASVESVKVTKTHNAPNQLNVIYAEVKGENLDKLGRNPVIIRDQSGKPKVLNTIVENEARLYYEIKDPDGIATLIVNNEDYNISGGDIPQVNGINPSNGLVNSDDTLIIQGDKFESFEKNGGKINFYNKTASKDSHSITVKDKTIEKKFLPTTPGGPYRVEFSKTYNNYGNDNENDKPEDVKNNPKLIIENNYVNIFTVLGSLNISNDVEMFPNQGSPGSKVIISGDDLTENMSVFFKENKSDLFDMKTMGEFVSYKKDANGKKDEFIVKVPNLPQGSYEVILTNKVKKGQDPNKIINSEEVFDNNIFIIISDANKPSIIQVEPRKGPATGLPATITGRYLGSMSKSVFEPKIDYVLSPGGKDTSEETKNSLKVSYKGKKEEIVGKYKALNTADGGVDVVELEREITGYIGNRLEFTQGSQLSVNGNDNINVIIQGITDEATDPIKDVTLEITTTIKYKAKDNDGENIIKSKEIKESVTKERGFEFEQLGYEPEISTITPDKIPVENEISNRYKTSLEDMKISIHGKNFSVYRYIVKDDNGNDVVKYKYPEVNIGNQIILNKNKNPDIDIKVYDKNGREVDGSENNDLGVKILVTIPKGYPEAGMEGSFVGSNTDTWVINPLRNENPTEMGYTSNPGTIRFVDIGADKTPTISSVSPDTVTTDGQKNVSIKGQNFYPGIKVYLDGEEVKNTKRNDTGTEITFDAPKGEEGFRQLLIQNEEGGADTYYPFTYTKTYTDPKIIDFNPKKGSANTLVSVSGKSFVRPNPLVTELEGIGIQKLIGTRIFLGDNDINEYNKDGKKIILKEYTSSKDVAEILYINDKGNLSLSDYYHSVILQDAKTKKYYTIYFDNNDGTIRITDGDKEVYTLGKLDGKPGMEFTVNKNNIEIENKTLMFKTPYKIEKGEIVGNRVKVRDNGELVFTVPPMPREGYYDVTVINPDTKSDTKKGENGFYYSFQPEFNPKIEKIDPNEGSTDGEYFIDIIGEGFIDRGGDVKTSVTIGNIDVDPKDITVLPDGNTLKVKVPKYPGNLEDETEMDRKTVAVVVVNPDGGSASMEHGFTYIIPISHPEITKLFLREGSATGGESVIIEGSGFRYFEPYKDENNDGEWQEGESFTDINNNGRWDDLRHWRNPETQTSYNKLLEKDNGYEKLIKPILPKIYFGSQEAKIIDFSASSIEVETPKGQKGDVDVYLVNNDYGTSNKLKYSYKASEPKIDTVVPGVGRKQGNDKVEILGSSFYNNSLLVITSKNSTKTQTMPLVQFGNVETDTNISNKTVSIDAPKNSGKIRDKKSTIEVGDLKVVYDISGNKRNLSFTITKGTGNDKKEYNFTYEDYKDTEIFFPTNLLKDKDGKAYNADGIASEYIRVKLDIIEGANSTTRVRVDRGFSPSGQLLNNRHISLSTPAYYTIGKTNVTIINPDGGIGSKNDSFEYKNPDSRPTITNILRDGQEGKLESYTENGETKNRKIVRVNIDGGNTIDILGTDFRKPVKIKIGDLPAIESGIDYDPQNESVSKKMTFKMPKINEEYINEIHRVVIENEDGGTAGSDGANPPIYIKFIKGETTGLNITGVDPKAGPAEGGTKIVISGKDFRKKMDGFEGEKLKVYFGEGKNQIRVPDANIDLDNTDTSKITLTTPSYKPGTVTIKVENPDGSITELKNAFTYISNPKITKIVDPLNNDTEKKVLSINGGETINIVGSDFLKGAKVIFNPVLKKSSDNKDAQGDEIFIDGVEYILESGAEGKDAEFIDSSNIKVETPSGTIGIGGVIVINPDNAATPLYDIEYGIPEITHPQDVRATLIKNEYIRINWDEVRDKPTQDDGKEVQYEVYLISEGSREFLGSTGTTGFIFKNIKPNTTYKFLVRAIGKYGSSKPLDESISNKVKTGNKVESTDKDGELGEKTKVEKSGDTAKVIIGTDAFVKGNEYTIDLTRGTLSGSKNVIVSMSAKIVVKEKNKKINIIGNDYNLSFSPNVFENSTLRNNKDKSSAGVKFEISPTEGRFELSNNRGDTMLASNYLLEAKAFIGASSETLENLNGKMNLILDYDQELARRRRFKESDINLVKYDVYNRAFKEVFGNRSSYGTSIGDIDELGIYTITGSRR